MNGIPCTSTRNLQSVFGEVSQALAVTPCAVYAHTPLSVQGCLQFLGLVFTEQLYQLGAIGMAFGVFEVSDLSFLQVYLSFFPSSRVHHYLLPCNTCKGRVTFDPTHYL